MLKLSLTSSPNLQLLKSLRNVNRYHKQLSYNLLTETMRSHYWMWMFYSGCLLCEFKNNKKNTYILFVVTPKVVKGIFFTPQMCATEHRKHVNVNYMCWLCTLPPLDHIMTDNCAHLCEQFIKLIVNADTAQNEINNWPLRINAKTVLSSENIIFVGTKDFFFCWKKRNTF